MASIEKWLYLTRPGNHVTRFATRCRVLVNKLFIKKQQSRNVFVCFPKLYFLVYCQLIQNRHLLQNLLLEQNDALIH